MKIIDNFLFKDELKTIQEAMMGPSFPWYYNPIIVYNDINPENNKFDPKDYYFTHTFFLNATNSQHFKMIQEIILPKFDWFALKRVKGNFYPPTGKIIDHPKHIDYKPKHKGMIFSINTCNGATVLSDGKKIKSVANRALFFDTSKFHGSTNCSDAKGRFNININYI